MDIAEWWRQLSTESRDWLAQHNGEALDAQVKAEVLSLNNERTDPSWWFGESVDGQSELTNEAIDWIEARANGEVHDKI